MSLDLGLSQTNVSVDRPTHDAGKDTSSPAPAVVSSENHQRWTKTTKPRGRQPKDPHAQSVRFQCRDVDDQERQLRSYLQNPTHPVEHTTLEFVYPVSAAFSVYTADYKNKHNTQKDARAHHLYGRLDRSAVSVIDALAPTEDPKDHMRRQKAIAKICMEACERVDGFRYSFHNNWLSREDEACRFSYFCNDSTLNKGRAANEGAGTFGKKMRKPVYDCHGLIAVKFSQTKQNLEVHYKHIPLHSTYNERAPPPRKDSKRYKLLEVFNPEELPPIKRAKKSSQNEAETPERPRKRKAFEPLSGVETSAETDSIESGPGGANYGLSDLPTPDKTTFIPPSQPSEGVLAQQRSNSVEGNRLTNRPNERQTTSRAQQSASATVVESSPPNKGLRWSMVTQSMAARDKSTATTAKKSTNIVIRSEPELAINTITMSEFQALKAKLEEAEQRIKKLEAEKQTAQPAGPISPQWGQYPPPIHYSYQYGPPAYPYPAQAIPPPGYHQQPHAPPPLQPPHPPPQFRAEAQQAQYSSQTDIPDTRQGQPVQATVAPASATTTAREPHVRTKENKSAVRGFVSYTPKPQKPILNAQKQDAIRP